MSTIRLVDPELRPMLEMLPKNDFSDSNIKDIRKKMKSLMEAMPSTKIEGVQMQEHYIEKDGFKIRVLVYSPTTAEDTAKPALLYIHGGGYVMGSPDEFVARNEMFCKELGAVVVSVDYRLAPEHRYPIPLEDCYAALAWIFENLDALDVNGDKVGIYGESAGGGLAAALALLTRDRKEFSIAHQFLVYPMLDDRTCVTPEPNPYTGEFVWTPESNHYGWSSLLGHEPGLDGVSPYASPARIDVMVGLPNAYICVGTLDLFLDEDIAYAQRLLLAGVQTELHVYPGAFHGFDMVPGTILSRQFEDDLLRAMKKAFS